MTSLVSLGAFHWKKDFIANASNIPPLPDVTDIAPETGDSLVPVRSALRGAAEWSVPMALVRMIINQ